MRETDGWKTKFVVFGMSFYLSKNFHMKCNERIQNMLLYIVFKQILVILHLNNGYIQTFKNQIYIPITNLNVA